MKDDQDIEEFDKPRAMPLKDNSRPLKNEKR